jgi:tRNA G37 N-methylase TrmD
MNSSDRTFTYLTILCVLVICGASGIGMVWMRQQISRTADRIRTTEQQIAEVERRVRFLDERIAASTQPRNLQARVANQLRPAREDQLVFIQERYTGDTYVYAVRDAFEVSADLALLNSGAVVEEGL